MNKLACLIVVLFCMMLSGALCAQTMQNGHFVTPYVYIDSNTTVANSWTPYRLSASPNFMQSQFEQMPGGPGGQVSCQQIWADWSAYEAGVYQRISGAVIGQCYRAKGWFMSIYRHGQAIDSIQDGNIYQRIGIDPYGGTNANSSNVIWSWNDPLDRRWRELPVDAVAQSTTITVFARTNNLYPATNCLSFYDAFSLEQSSPIEITNVKVRPGATDAIVTWTTNVPATSNVDYGTYQGPDKSANSASNSSLKTSHSITITGLTPNTKYFCTVKSTASGKSDTKLGIFLFTTLAGQYYPSLRQAKNNPDGTQVFLRNMLVSTATTQLSGMFFVQEQDRTSGIRVHRGLNTTPCALGDMIDISGTLSTVSGERRLANIVFTKIDQISPPRPLAVSNKSVGGVQSDPYTPAVAGSLGPNNSGLLVTVWGRITYLNTTSKYCYIDDGSGLEDSTAAGRKGIKVYWYNTLGTFNVQPDKYILATGLSSCFQDTNGTHPMIIVRSPQDIIQF